MAARPFTGLAAGLALAVLALSGCASVQVEGPIGDPVKLAKPNLPASKRVFDKTWYMFWGLVPLSEVSTSQMIRESRMEVVRVRTYMGADDFLMSLIGVVPIIPVSRTIMIEGN